MPRSVPEASGLQELYCSKQTKKHALLQRLLQKRQPHNPEDMKASFAELDDCFPVSGNVFRCPGIMTNSKIGKLGPIVYNQP